MITRITLDDRKLWCKIYPQNVYWRRFLLMLWNPLVSGFGLRLFASPSRLAGKAACQLEHRRIEHLRLLGAKVPEIVGHGDNLLLLSDMGNKLSSTLKANLSSESRDELVTSVLKAIADVHAADGYLGQPVTRNIIIDDGNVGFIDFEEDVLTILNLAQAQARDILLLVYTLSNFYPDDAAKLASLVTATLQGQDHGALPIVRHTAKRMRWIGKVAFLCGKSGKKVAHAITIIAKI